MRVVILAHEQFPDDAKTAMGVLRYGDHEVVAVLDRSLAGNRVSEVLEGADRGSIQDAPIVSEMEEAPDADALIIGIAPIGGGFEASWRPDIRTALSRGCEVISGLHYQLASDDEFTTLATRHGATLTDVRKPPSDLGVATGEPVDAQVVLTVGTDCSVGKMTASFELREAARKRGIDATVVPTGQTGIMISGWGISIDRVIADFAAGATEQLVHEATDHDLLIVEGQGALCHPAYSGVTASILHGSQPDSLVLCHEAGRTQVNSYDVPIPDPARYATLYESVLEPVADATVDAGMLDTSGLADDEARSAITEQSDALGVPVTDPVRFDADTVLDAVL